MDLEIVSVKTRRIFESRIADSINRLERPIVSHDITLDLSKLLDAGLCKAK